MKDERIKPSTSGVTGRMENVHLQRNLELLGQKNSLGALTGVPTNLARIRRMGAIFQRFWSDSSIMISALCWIDRGGHGEPGG
jgi:hypothetical protein